MKPELTIFSLFIKTIQVESYIRFYEKLFFTLNLLFFISFCIQAQTMVSTCSNDTIKLIAENYQYGVLEWEKSLDSISWTRIDNAHGNEYVFVPVESAYYRVVNKFTNCDPQFSTVFFVDKLPVANAGSNRIVNNSYVYLTGNSGRNSTSTWSIIEGSGGELEQPNLSSTKFTGIPADGNPDGPSGRYILCYTLENSCGVSHDTIEVNFVNNQYYDKIVIVDETDTITTDSTQLFNGLYSIRFSNPVPVIDNQTILIGIVGDGFMRKVSSVVQNGNYFELETSQAKIEEILTKGGLELGQLYNFDPINETYRVKGYNRLNKVPTRAELLTEEKFKTGSHFFIVDEHMETDLDGVTISKVKRNDKTQRIKNENYDSQNNEDEFVVYSFVNTTLYDKNGIKANLDGVLEFVPNIVSDIKVNWLDFEDTNVNIGVDNAKVSFKSKLTVTSSGSYNSELDQITLGTVHKKMIVVVGGVPTLLQIKTQLKLATTFSATGNVTYVNEYEKTYKVSAGVKYEDNEWTNYFSENESSSMKHDLQVKGTLAPSFELGPIIYFTINGIAGPYVDTRLTTDLTLCASTQNFSDFNWQVDAKLGAKLTLGIHGYMFKKKLFDYSKTWENRNMFHEIYPYSMEYVSGNNQQYALNTPLSQPLRVRLLSKNGKPAGGILVSFVPLNNSGTVSTSLVITDSDGYAQTFFTPTTDGVCNIIAYAKDCNFNNLQHAPLTFVANRYDCSKSTLSANFIKNDNQLTLNGFMGVPPYSYSTDSYTFSTTPPKLVIEDGKEYTGIVKDVNGCYAYAYYKPQENSCNTSTLRLNIEQLGNKIKAVATGGRTPYSFSINNQGYSSISEFANLPNGKYTIKVKDGQGCERQTMVTVSIEAFTYGIVTSLTGRVWMDRNLGASRVATSSTDDQAYGDLYQWGRDTDGHEKRTSQKISSLSSSDTPGHGKFITAFNSPYDWRSPQNDSLWQRGNGFNNPCPEGFRIPTAYEWDAERVTWSSNSPAGAFASSLKLPVAGICSINSYIPPGFAFLGEGNYGVYWSSTVNGGHAQYLYFYSGTADMGVYSRTSGLSVRCIKENSVEVKTVTSPTGRVWMDRNLGASRVATSSTDDQAYGDLYQWGRSTDGHEKRTSETTSSLSSSDTPGHGKFIVVNIFSVIGDWRSPQNNSLWQGVNGTNNPCPVGFRIPTAAEWSAERANWSSNSSAGAFSSPLKLLVAGYRYYVLGSLNDVGSHGYYWSSTVDGTQAQHLYFSSGIANMNIYNRAHGRSVRCIMDN